MPILKGMKEYEILGQKLTMTSGDDRELAEFAVQLVHQKIDEIQQNKPFMGPHQVAVLALLNLAGEMMQDRKTMDEYRRQLDERCATLMTELSHLQQ